MNKVAIVIPTHKARLNSDDLISLRHLRKFLNRYDKYFVIPENVDPKGYKQKGVSFIKFPKKFFETWRGYNELLLQKEFYEKFEKYEYILIYQLDVLVFSDQLLEFYKKGYDFIAPPWFYPVIGTLSRKEGSPASGGNGGFSLRKLSSAIRVLEEVNKNPKRNSPKDRTRKAWFLKALLTGQSRKIWLNAPADNYPFAEDGFWTLEAPKYLSGYKVAPFKEALQFGFEKFPRRCFKLNNKKLPFGVHAWKKHDQDFWKPYILK